MPFRMPPTLHDPATYDRGFPHEVFRELRDREPVSHQEHPAWERGYSSSASTRRSTRSCAS